VRATLVHLAGSEWLHGRAVRGEDVTEPRPFTAERYPDFLSLEGAWRGLNGCRGVKHGFWFRPNPALAHVVNQSLEEPGAKPDPATAIAFDYLTELERYADRLPVSPQLWMPWNYRDARAS
jgi:hypothetical protein